MEEPESDSNVSLHSDVCNLKSHSWVFLIFYPIERGLSEWVDGFEFKIYDVKASPPSGNLGSDGNSIWDASAEQVIACNWYSESKNVINRVSGERGLNISWLFKRNWCRTEWACY